MHHGDDRYPERASFLNIDINHDKLVYEFNQWKENLPEMLGSIRIIEKPNFDNMVLCLLTPGSLTFLERDE